jgi:hypothetical protein
MRPKEIRQSTTRCQSMTLKNKVTNDLPLAEDWKQAKARNPGLEL